MELRAANLSQAGPIPAQPHLVLLNLFFQVNLLLDQYSTAGDRELSMTEFLVRIDLLELFPKQKAKAYHLIYIERPQHNPPMITVNFLLYYPGKLDPSLCYLRPKCHPYGNQACAPNKQMHILI